MRIASSDGIDRREHPVLLNDAMVLATIAETKTQTRRPIVLGNSDFSGDWSRLEFDAGKVPKGAAKMFVDGHFNNGYLHVPTRPHPSDLQDGKYWTRTRVYPKWQIGDLLYVREAIQALEMPSGEDGILYRADHEWREIPNTREAAEAWVELHRRCCRKGENDPSKWIPNILAPKWTSRLWLRVKRAWPEQVRKISENDAKAEGASFHDGGETWHSGWRHDYKDVFSTARASFCHSWNSIYATKGFGWDLNPWVWATEFEMVEEGR